MYTGRTQFDRVRVSLGFGDEPSRTQQHFVDETNINNIMGRYKKTGVCDSVNTGIARYQDNYVVGDYRSSLDCVLEGEQMFAALPADVRKKFSNDAEKFAEFIINSDNEEALKELGIGIAKPGVKEPEAPKKEESKVEDKDSKEGE